MTEKDGERYTDDFRAGALELLRAAGYDFENPKAKGNQAAINRTHKALRMPEATLRGWARKMRRHVPPKLREFKRGEMVTAFWNEIGLALHQMDIAREDASYKDLATAVGILTDKLQLLTGEPTANNNTKIIIEYSDEPELQVDLADAIDVATASDQRGETV